MSVQCAMNISFLSNQLTAVALLDGAEALFIAHREGRCPSPTRSSICSVTVTRISDPRLLSSCLE
jgi:hypothetical protein